MSTEIHTYMYCFLYPAACLDIKSGKYISLKSVYVVVLLLDSLLNKLGT